MGASIYLGKVLSAGTKGCNIIVPTTSIDPDAQAFLTAAGITDATISSAINTLVIDLKGYSIWTKMKALYPMVGGTSSTHKFNLKNPLDTDAAFRLVFNGGWTHSSTGALPNGTNAYANTYLNPSVSLAQNSTHLSYYSRTNISANQIETGILSSSPLLQTYLLYSFSGTSYKSINRPESISGSIATPTTGLLIGSRANSTTEKYYKSGSLLSTITVNSTGLINGNIFLGSANNVSGAGATFYSSKQVAFSSIGDGLTDTEAANFYTAVQTFQTTLGRQVGTPIPYTSFPLDTYTGAEAAYSLRRLRTAYTGNLIRVRRSSDNTEMDFGYNTNNVLDTASLLTFCGAGNGFVTTWYDQSGNANNGTQTTAINQPQIVSSGAMVTVNGNNSMSFDGSNDSFNLTSSITAAASNFNTFVGKRDAIGRRLYGLAGGVSQQYFWGISNDNFAYLQAKTTGYNTSASNGDTTQLLLTGLNSAGTMSMFKNGNTLASGFTTTSLNVGIGTIANYSGNNSQLIHCNLQEIVFYNSDQLSNRTGIESNINSFYTIY